MGRKRLTAGDNWSYADHTTHLETKVKNIEKKCRKKGINTEQKYNNGYYKQTHLARGSKQNLESTRLKLHITKTQKQVRILRERLTNWDDEEEKALLQKQRQREAQQRIDDELHPKKKKRTRPGPETWKLRGAARPAWQVYDFDTRYVCPHAAAHRHHREKQLRLRNVLCEYRGRLTSDDAPQPHCRDFLALLCQLGHLNFEARKFKSAREAFKECVDLEGDEEGGVTNARRYLMRLYLEANRPDAARRLWERCEGDVSVWIRYSAALLEFVSWRVLGEDGSTRETAEGLLARAVRANPFCAFYIAFHGTFEEVVEFGDEVEDAEEGSVEEAVEYCGSEVMGCWVGTEGAVEWVRRVLIRAWNGISGRNGGLTRGDMDWEEKLKKRMEMQHSVEDNAEEKKEGDEGDADEDAPDTEMYVGMFRTAMEMLEETGELNANVDESDDERNCDNDQNTEMDDAEIQLSTIEEENNSEDQEAGRNCDGNSSDSES